MTWRKSPVRPAPASLPVDPTDGPKDFLSHLSQQSGGSRQQVKAALEDYARRRDELQTGGRAIVRAAPLPEPESVIETKPVTAPVILQKIDRLQETVLRIEGMLSHAPALSAPTPSAGAGDAERLEALTARVTALERQLSRVLGALAEEAAAATAASRGS